MATELAKSFSLADEADLTSVVAEPTGLGAGVPVSESLSGTGGFGVDPAEAAGEKAGLLGRSDAPRTVELEVKKEAFVMLSGGLGVELCPDHQHPVLGISDLVTEEGVIDAEMSAVAVADAEMGTAGPVDSEMGTARCCCWCSSLSAPAGAARSAT
jgi:hypothetical protein